MPQTLEPGAELSEWVESEKREFEELLDKDKDGRRVAAARSTLEAQLHVASIGNSAVSLTVAMEILTYTSAVQKSLSLLFNSIVPMPCSG